MWKKLNFPVALQMELYLRHTSECYQNSPRKKSEVGDATLDWLWSTNKLNSFYDRNTDGPSTPLLLLSFLSFSFSVSLCQVLNNLGAELVIFSNYLVQKKTLKFLGTYTQLKQSMILVHVWMKFTFRKMGSYRFGEQIMGVFMRNLQMARI